MAKTLRTSSDPAGTASPTRPISWTVVVWLNAFAFYVPHSVSAQGIGPPPGTEVLLYLFLAGAAVFVAISSAVFFRVFKKWLFKDREPTRLQKAMLVALSIFASGAAGIAAMISFNLR